MSADSPSLWHDFARHRLAVAGVVVLAVLGALTVLAPWIAPHEPSSQDPSNTFASPWGSALFGTDSLGRDQLSRLLYGGRVSLAVGLGVALLSGIIGTTVGVIAGTSGRLVDGLLMRITDLFLALPVLVVLIVGSATLEGSTLDIVAILALVSWMSLARIVRGVVLSLREQEFIAAAVALGASRARIVLRHLIPNLLGPVTVNVTLTVASAILLESILSFLGFGVQPPTPTWGSMLADSRTSLQTAPWLVWFPGLAILATVMSVNLVGDGLRDALDPRSGPRADHG